MFLSPTYYSIWLCHRTTVDLFVGFHVGDSDCIAILKSYSISIYQYASSNLES